MGTPESITEYIRKHLEQARCPDEPFETEHQPYQDLLERAYKCKNSGESDQARQILEQQTDDLPKSPHQRLKSNFVLGHSYETLDRRGIPVAPNKPGDFSRIAAVHYAKAADVAEEIADLALVAHLRSLESAGLFFSSPYDRPYRRASAAAKHAFQAWRKCQDAHDSRDYKATDDLHFQFALADAVGARAQLVVEDEDAVDALEQAAISLLMLSEREDRDDERYRNDDQYLAWNWAALHHSMGKYEDALKRALEAREKAERAHQRALETQDEQLLAARRRNYGRVNALIAEIALDCIDFGPPMKKFPLARLLNIAEGACATSLEASKASEDEIGYILALLVNARWLGRTQWKRERLQMLDDAERSAAAILAVEPITMGRVEIGRGDEYAYRYRKQATGENLTAAQDFYRKAAHRFREVDALNLERLAQKRLMRLFQRSQS